ncbi:tyrosine-type recombinase/integrase [Pseudonocardia sp.]|uniref:tyrosine-type recombinase/integrase n=1 Tax=Pseudonocardia sp. TaxID=60912 RepID=UPI003D0F8B10
MTSRKRTRQPNMASSIYEGKDGYWHGRVTVGVKDDGKPDRRHVMRKSRADVVKAVRELERQRDKGSVRNVGRVWTVAEWLNYWVESIAAPAVRESTADGYRVAIRTHLVPGIGAHRLDRLEPEHLERLYARMVTAGSSPGTAHQAHRTIRTALGEAERRGRITRNPAKLAKPPRVDETEIEPYTVEEVQALLKAASTERNSARWAIALALGLRQGEVLGLRWKDVDLDAGTLWVRRGRLRPKYAHGCGDTCGRKAGYCPNRQLTRPETDDTKSRAGRRAVGLPDELVALLRTHRDEQAAEQDRAAQLWRDSGYVFTTPRGEPVNPSTDYHHWKRLLAGAGLRDGRLHDARHTAATVLLILGVPERAVMGLMGWSTTAMAARYQHMTVTIRNDIARRIDGLIWGSNHPKE